MAAIIQSSCSRFTMPPSPHKGRAALDQLRSKRQLTDEQHEILLGALKLAYKPHPEDENKSCLYGCDCAFTGQEMPCEHILEFLNDPALNLIIRTEKALGHRGPDVLNTVSDELAQKADPENNASHHVSKTPKDATDADPGSLDKIEVLQGRIERGEAVRREGDVFDYWFHAALENEEEDGDEYDD